MDEQLNVKTVSGLQNVLQAGVDNHFTTPDHKRDHDWTRLTAMCVNSGNGLLRTQLRVEEIADRREREARKAKTHD